MKLYVKGKKIIVDCSEFEFKKGVNPYNSSSIPDAVMLFMERSKHYWGKDYINRSLCLDFTHEEIETNYDMAKIWSKALVCAKLAAEELNIEIAADFEGIKELAFKRERELYAEQEERYAKNRAILRWGLLCENGCGGCPKKHRCGDDNFCLASGDLLPEKPVAGFNNSVYQLFDYKAFPTENCLYNVNKNQGGTVCISGI